MLLRILLQPVGGADAMSLLQCPFFSEQKTSLMKKNAPVLDVVSNILVQLYNKKTMFRFYLSKCSLNVKLFLFRCLSKSRKRV